MPLRGVVAAKGVVSITDPSVYSGALGKIGKVLVGWWDFEKSLIWRKFAIEKDA
jgi:hypothetical protein